MDLGGGVEADRCRKAEADRALAASGLAYTIVRPGRLTDDPPTGHVQIGERLERAEISRADVAAVLAAVLEARNTIGKSFDVVAGELPVARAIAGP
ncbi:MAG: NAD(P)H-binding protein [Solirubrobacterales bacterium]